MNGGYIIISKNQADAYALSSKALELGKPILWYEDETTCYYIDTISKSGTDIVLTKGGKTITIEADGDITEDEKHLNQYVICDNDDYYVIKVLSNINCVVDDTDNGDWTNEEIKALYDLFIDIFYQNSQNAIIGSAYSDNQDKSVTFFFIKSTNYIELHISDTNGDLVNVKVEKNDDTYTITNSTGYLYLNKFQLI